MSDFASRLREITDRLGGVRAAARAAQMPEQTLWRWLSGKSKPQMEGVASVARAAGVSLDWLVFGSRPISEASDDVVAIPVLDVAPSAGHGAIVEREEVTESIGLPRRLLREQHINPAHAHILYIRGDSMEPTLREGDIVLLDRGHQGEVPRREGIYVLRVDGELMVKRMVFAGQRGEGRDMQVIWRLVSDNPAYPPIEVDLFGPGTRLEILGRVRLVMRWM